MTESELRLEIMESRKDGFRIMFQQYHGYVYAIVWNRICKVASHEDAEECVNDIFTDIFLQFDLIEEGKLQSYIRTVAKRKAINCFYRMTAKPLSVSLDETEYDTIASDDDIEQNYEKAELRKTLLNKIKMLGYPDEIIVMMKYYYDSQPEEIAKATHLSRAAVRMRLSRAIKRLAKLLEEDGYTINGGKS